MCWRRSRPRAAPFHRGVLFAWGFSNGQFTFTQAAQRCKAAGYEWATLELDAPDQRSEGGTVGEWNTEHWADFRAAFHAVGIKAGPWWTEGGNIARTPVESDLTLAECEGPGDYEGIVIAEQSGLVPDVPKAIVTNFNVPLRTSSGELNPAAAKILIDAGYYCLTEAYLGDNPNATPDRLDFTAKRLGWSASQPVFGVWNAAPSVYAPWATWPGADYLGEYVL